MNKGKRSAFSLVTSYLSDEIKDDVSKYLKVAGVNYSSVSEIRLRAQGKVGLVVSGKNVLLGVHTDKTCLKEIFKKICDGAIFSRRDEICRGYVTLGDGVRVGVCGHAKYEEGRMVGVSDVASLVFRIPCTECSFTSELFREWMKLGGGGMLICSRAGEGKTTAIRFLSRLIGSGDNCRRVVVVDERCEFCPDDYVDSHVDILRGYRRALGIDIAIRTMSAEVIVVDEISSADDSQALLSAIGAGATVIATVHAPNFEGAMGREYVSRLVTSGLFSSVCSVFRTNNAFSFSLQKIDLESSVNSHGMGDLCRT